MLGTGHKSNKCEGPDRSALCYKCGKEGHGSKAYGNELYCPICDTKGHRVSTSGCPVHRKVLRKEM